MNLHEYDIIIINSSAGKDSLCAMWSIVEMAKEQKYPLSKVVGSHQDLGKMEWSGTKELFTKHCKLFGIKAYYSERKTKEGKSENLLEYTLRRGKWPSNKQRWCTSDLKRGPGARVVTMLTKDMKKCNMLYVFGFRAEESPARSKKEVLVLNKNLTTKKRTVWDYLPIHDWSAEFVWGVIKSNSLPYHFAYDLGMPRLSCVFCIFSPFDALVIAGINNPELLDEYIDVEIKTGHSFRDGFKIASVKEAIISGYIPEKVSDWVM